MSVLNTKNKIDIQGSNMFLDLTTVGYKDLMY